MFIPVVYEYRIPAWAVCPLAYGDFSSLSDNEIHNVEGFTAALPAAGGVWSFGENPFFAPFNDITRYEGSTVVDSTYTVLSSKEPENA